MGNPAVFNEKKLPDSVCAIKAQLEKVVRTPRQNESDWGDFIWRNVDGSREMRTMRITLDLCEALGIGEDDDVFVGDEFLRHVFCPLEAQELDTFQVSHVGASFPELHKSSDFPLWKRVVGKRKKRR